MFWAIPAAGALLGALSGKAKHDKEMQQQRSSADVRAAEINASPWTKMSPQTQVQFAGSTGLGDMIGGATGGLSAVQGLSKGFGPQNSWEFMAAAQKKRQEELMANSNNMAAPSDALVSNGAWG